MLILVTIYTMLSIFKTITRFMVKFMSILLKITVSICEFAYTMCNYRITQILVLVLAITYRNILGLCIAIVLFLVMLEIPIDVPIDVPINVPIDVPKNMLNLEIDINPLYEGRNNEYSIHYSSSSWVPFRSSIGIKPRDNKQFLKKLSNIRPNPIFDFLKENKCSRCLDKYIESSKKINCIHKDICNECTKNRDECPKCGTKYE